MFENVKFWRGVWACGPCSALKSLPICGVVLAPQAPASSMALAKVYEASVYQPATIRFSYLSWSDLYQFRAACEPTVIPFHCGYGRLAATLPSKPKGT